MKRAELTGSLGALAGRAKQALPGMVVHQHLRDAAGAVRAKNDAGARRHLHAAIASLAPQSVSRHGITDDASHQAAKRIMNEASRHVLLVKDASDRRPEQDAAQLAAQHGQAIELARRAVRL